MSHPGRMTVRAAALTGFASLCRSYGVEAGPLLRAVGLPGAAEADPDRRVPAAAVDDAFERAALACGCDDFGVRLSELRGFANLGPIGLIARDEPTVGAAIGAITAYLPLHNDALLITREDHGEITVLRATILGAGRKVQATDIAVAMIHRIIRQFAGTAWQAEEVCLTRPAPGDPARFRQVLGPRLRFGAEFDGIVVRTDLLARPNPLAEVGLRSYASQAMRLAQPGGGATMAERVRRVLALLLSTGRCTAGHVAAQLGVSRRTLTRALADEGTRFLALLDAEREDVARRHLAARARSLTDIADLLGFSSPAAFSTWFRHRFGQSPRDWRRMNS